MKRRSVTQSTKPAKPKRTKKDNTSRNTTRSLKVTKITTSGRKPEPKTKPLTVSQRVSNLPPELRDRILFYILRANETIRWLKDIDCYLNGISDGGTPICPSLGKAQNIRLHFLPRYLRLNVVHEAFLSDGRVEEKNSSNGEWIEHVESLVRSGGGSTSKRYLTPNFDFRSNLRTVEVEMDPKIDWQYTHAISTPAPTSIQFDAARLRGKIRRLQACPRLSRLEIRIGKRSISALCRRNSDGSQFANGNQNIAHIVQLISAIPTVRHVRVFGLYNLNMRGPGQERDELPSWESSMEMGEFRLRQMLRDAGCRATVKLDLSKSIQQRVRPYTGPVYDFESGWAPRH